MMNLARRIKVSSLVFRLFSAGTYYWCLIVDLLTLPAHAGAALGKRTIKRRLEKYKNAATKYCERSNSILPELQKLDLLTEPRRKQVLAARAALLKEHGRLQMSASRFTSYRAPGAVFLIPTLVYVRTKLVRRKRKAKSFEKIIERIEGDTFYLDLLLWSVVPVAYAEELLGDLNEEYSLRHSTDGERGAKSWYRDQVARTLKDCFWKRIERLAAIGTLVDLLDRWFRK